MNKQKILFLDMDGVLADFDSKINGELNNMFKKEFFRSLVPLEEGLNDTIQKLQEMGFIVKILSKVPVKKGNREYLQMLVDKGSWVMDNIHSVNWGDIHIQAIDENKGEILQYYPNDEYVSYLVDDYTPNLVNWALYGGIGIKKAKRIKTGRCFKQILNLHELVIEGI